MSERYQKRKTALLMIHRCFTLIDSIIILWSTSYKMLRFFYQLPTNSRTFSQPSKLLIGSIDEYCLDDVCFLPTVLDTAKRKKTNNENHDSLWTENQCTMKEKRLPFLAYFRWIKSFLDHKVKSIVSQFSHWIWFSLFWQKRTCKLLFIFIKSELGIWLCSKFLKGRCGVGGGGGDKTFLFVFFFCS